MSWIDVHTHLQMLNGEGEQALKEAQKEGIEYIINIGTCEKDWEDVIQWTQHKNVFGTLGMHPHEAKTYTDSVEQKLKSSIDKESLVAIGEIGLDYYYEHSDRKIQREVFRKQMDIAKEKKLPVQIHTRSAEQDTIEILKEYKGDVQGLLHCFTGSLDMAKKALDIGYNISFSGILTFKNASSLCEVCEFVPIDRLHLETDAPYLAPAPHRGKKNKPSYLVHTARKMAEIKKQSLENLQNQTLTNANLLFNLGL